MHHTTTIKALGETAIRHDIIPSYGPPEVPTLDFSLALSRNDVELLLGVLQGVLASELSEVGEMSRSDLRALYQRVGDLTHQERPTRAEKILRDLTAAQVDGADHASISSPRAPGALFPVSSGPFYVALCKALAQAGPDDEVVEVFYAFQDGWIVDLKAYASVGLRQLKQLKMSWYRFALEAPQTGEREPLKLRPEDRA